MTKFKEKLKHGWRVFRKVLYFSIVSPLWFIMGVLLLVSEMFSWFIVGKSVLTEWVKLDEADSHGGYEHAQSTQTCEGEA